MTASDEAPDGDVESVRDEPPVPLSDDEFRDQLGAVIPHLRAFVTSLYACEYGNFFRALADVEQTHILTSRALHQHARYYVREMRILAYAQLLESYRSLTLESMSTAFGVSIDFIDK